ncbi:MAG: response regulator [Nannocystales bacterium]
MNVRAAEILLVEDNPGDILLTRKAFKSSKVLNTLHVVTDGRSALEFLRRQGKFPDAPRPDLILLDINLPGLDGHEVLAAIKDDDELCQVPVVMLTSSEQERDISASYRHHANSYICKPPSLAGLSSVLNTLQDYWFAVVRLPPPGAPA